jgi:GT2 family glycosyltransferase
LTDAGFKYPEGGIFGPKIYDYTKPNKIWYAGGKWSSRLSELQHIGMNFVDNGNYFNSMAETEFVPACALLVRTEVIRKVGLFDENFFLGYEEADLCYRTKRAGYKCFFVPQAKVWHKLSPASTECDPALIKYYSFRNKLLWAKRNLPVLEQFCVWRNILSEISKNLLPGLEVPRSTEYSYFRTLYWEVRSCSARWQRNLPELKAEFAGVRDYLLGRFGVAR